MFKKKLALLCCALIVSVGLQLQASNNSISLNKPIASAITAPACVVQIESITVSACDAATNTYSIDVSVTYLTVSGNLDINGTIFTPSGANNEIFTLTGLIADGSTGNTVLVTSVDDVDCWAQDVYDAPAACAAPSIDLALAKTVDVAAAAIGDPLVYTLTLTNEGGTDATGVVVTDMLPAGVDFDSTSDAVNAVYDSGSHTVVWTVGGFLAADSPLTLTISGTVNAEGVHYNQAEITAMDGTDDDSTPGNGNILEDDMGNACTSTPVELCEGQTLDLQAPTGLANYQWYLDGTAIDGATTENYTVDYAAPGSYTFTADTAATDGCPASLCCPVVVQQGVCAPDCPAPHCIPMTITKTN